MRHCAETEETIAEWDGPFLRRWVNFPPTVWGRTGLVPEAAADPEEVQAFQRVCP